MSAIRERLRRGTRSMHDALEARLPVAGPDAGLDEYRDHLEWLLGFHEPLENAIGSTAELARALPDVDERAKVPLLRADLRKVDAPTKMASVRSVTNASSALGALYVLEGAGLGGKIVLDRLRRRGVVPGPVGSRYLEGYRTRTGDMWRRLCDALDSLPERASDEAVASAKRTFAELLVWRDAWERS